MQQDIFSKMESLKDSDFISVGEVKEDDFLNDIESAVNTGSGAPPKVEKTDGQETEAPSDAEHQGEPEPGEPAYQSPKNVGDFMSADAAFLLVDNLIPLAIVYGLKMTGRNVKKSVLQAGTIKEQNAVKGALDSIMKELNVDLSNPWTRLAVVMVSIYGLKAADVYMNTEPEKVVKSDAAPKKDGRGRPRKNF